MFISFLLLVVTGVSAGNGLRGIEVKELPSYEQKSFIDRLPYKRGVAVPSDLHTNQVLECCNNFMGAASILQQPVAGYLAQRGFLLIAEKATGLVRPVLNDHFRHLFPFYHFW